MTLLGFTPTTYTSPDGALRVRRVGPHWWSAETREPERTDDLRGYYPPAWRTLLTEAGRTPEEAIARALEALANGVCDEDRDAAPDRDIDF